MALISTLLLFHILVSILCTITSLPITSKPIENTPEHIAWEAWIMVPSTNDKTRKITPKSIFIVPNSTNNGGNNAGGNGNGLGGANGKGSSYLPQIQCPPGHTIDNLKCIPTVSIDQNQILITRLTNLVHSTNKYNGSNDGDSSDSYDYDYEYDTYEADESQAFAQPGLGMGSNGNNPLALSSSSSSSSDYNGEPLKINLSFGKFPPISQDDGDVNNSKEKDNFDVVEDTSREQEDVAPVSSVDTVKKVGNDEIKLQPFRGKETSSSTTSTPTTSQPTKSIGTTTNSFSTIPTREAVTETGGINTSSSTTTSTTVFPDKVDTSVSNKSTVVHTRTAEANDAATSIPILSPSETEILNTASNVENSSNKYLQDYDLDEQSTSRTTTIDDDMEVITNFDEAKTENFKDVMETESLILEQNDQKTTVGIGETTETEEQIPTTTFLNQLDEGRTDTVLPEDNPETVEVSKTTVAFSKPTEKSTTTTTKQQYLDLHEEQNLTPKPHESIEVHDHAAPLMETLENNNRFIYHHLSSASAPNSVTTKSDFTSTTTTSPDIREQLRIINQIVEENKKRTAEVQQGSQIRFPETNENHRNTQTSHQNHYPHQNYHNRNENVRSDFVRFPTDSQSSPSRVIPISFHNNPSPSTAEYLYPTTDRRYFQSQPAQTQSVSSIQQPSVISPTGVIGAANSDIQQNSKPFWWLPTGWEVDRTGDRPMLVRFWSRMPTESYSADTNGHRRLATSPSISSTSTLTTSTTSRYRENSRSPTEDLYRQEISGRQQHHRNYNHNNHHRHHQQNQQQHQQLQLQSQSQPQLQPQLQPQPLQPPQDIYRVLGAKHWKHNNR